MASFQLKLEHPVSHDVPRGVILSSAIEVDVPSLCTFLKILSRNGPEYCSDDIDHYTPPCMCYHIDGEVPPKEAPELTLLD